MTPRIIITFGPDGQPIARTEGDVTITDVVRACTRILGAIVATLDDQRAEFLSKLTADIRGVARWHDRN